jgi:tryptophanyl-tRNA synthetase
MTQFKDKTGIPKFGAMEIIQELKQQRKLLESSKEIFVEAAEEVGVPVNKNTIDEKGLDILIRLNQRSADYLESIVSNRDKAQLGLYAYPVLMAADIIGYHATHVPVGADQKQHLELARDIAGAFNRAYETEFFPIPEPLIFGEGTRVMALTDGTKKMSKSDPSDYSRITLTDDADAISKKIKKAQTDSDPSVTFDEENRPSVANLLRLYAALSDSTPQNVAAKFADLKTGQFKSELADLAVEKLAPITTRMRELMNETTTLDGILKTGAEKARAIASPILADTMKMVGFLKV